MQHNTGGYRDEPQGGYGNGGGYGQGSQCERQLEDLIDRPAADHEVS